MLAGDSASFIATNPYAQIATPDANNLDLGYHHVEVSTTVSDPYSMTSQTTIVAGPSGSTEAFVTPRDTANNVIGAGLDVTATIQLPQGTVKDHGDGTYSVIFTHNVGNGSDTVDLTVNGVLITTPVVVTW